MPGILCSIYDPTDSPIEPKWQMGLHLVQHHPEHVLEQYSEPGLQLACVYHPEVCEAPRILVTASHVLAFYGNVYEDHLLSGADSESLCRTLLDRFLKNGADALQHLNGRYDIAVWNRHERTLYFVSDRFGANRHYLVKYPGELHIACEAKALAPLLDRVEVDPTGLASMLSFGYYLGDLTLLKGVKCLPNARYLQYCGNEDHLKIDRYWDYPYGEVEPLASTESELAAQLHEHLLIALKRQLRNVRKILLPISGGLDSRSLAELLCQCDFSGDVLAYSYGQPSSRDVRYGRAFAKKLGYDHVTIPTPNDFIVQNLEKAAWQFDAEWSGELSWTNYSHCHPVLGDTRGFSVLSGMYGDAVLGEILQYRSNSEREKEFIESRCEYFWARHQEYMGSEYFGPLFGELQAENVKKSLEDLVASIFSPIAACNSYYAQVRAQFENRVRRHTAMVAQSIEMDRLVLTPFLDRDLVDFTTKLPLGLFREKKLYKRMICDHLPRLAAMPYAKTGSPLAPSPFVDALRWRGERVLKYFEWIRKSLQRRNAFFNFEASLVSQKAFFEGHANELNCISPPLDADNAFGRLNGLLSGKITPSDQVCALITPAYYIQKLQQHIRGRFEI